MARSHVCLGCGLDLANERGTYDARFGELVIACARCGTAVTRPLRRPPALRTCQALFTLAWSLGALACAVQVNLGFALGLREALAGSLDIAWWTMLYGLIALPVISALFLTTLALWVAVLIPDGLDRGDAATLGIASTAIAISHAVQIPLVRRFDQRKRQVLAARQRKRREKRR